MTALVGVGVVHERESSIEFLTFGNFFLVGSASRMFGAYYLKSCEITLIWNLSHLAHLDRLRHAVGVLILDAKVRKIFHLDRISHDDTGAKIY